MRFGTPLVLNAFEYNSRVRARLPDAFWFPLVPILTAAAALGYQAGRGPKRGWRAKRERRTGRLGRIFMDPISRVAWRMASMPSKVRCHLLKISDLVRDTVGLL